MDDSTRVEVGSNPAEVARNRATGAGAVDDPYPRYDALRESGPVHSGTVSQAFGMEEMQDSFIWPERPQFSCYDWETVDRVLRDPQTFSSEWYSQTLGFTIGRSMIQMGGVEHRRYRALVQPSFTRKEMARWQARWVQPAVDSILDRLVEEDEPFDLYDALCSKVPVFTIASAYGVAPEEVPRFHELAVTTVSSGVTPEERVAAAEEIADSLRETIERRRVEPADDLIGLLCNIEVADPDNGSLHRLSDGEVLAFARLMLPAGAGTTYRGLGLMLLALLQTDQLDRLRADRSSLDAAIEETLRWEQPLTSAGRLVMRDTVLGGVSLPAGSVVTACLGAANHDPARWDDPHRFDLDRLPQPHASFGSGPHLCIGMHLARMEMRTAMHGVLDRLQGLRFDPDRPRPYVTGLLFRMPTALPVVCER
jgi:cytochrome P450